MNVDFDAICKPCFRWSGVLFLCKKILENSKKGIDKLPNRVYNIATRLRKATENMNENQEDITMTQTTAMTIDRSSLTDRELVDAINSIAIRDTDLCDELIRRAGLEEESRAEFKVRGHAICTLCRAARALGYELALGVTDSASWLATTTL
nr:MAG TPA: hypothetical protein [Caudoviricetes sp.]